MKKGVGKNRKVRGLSTIVVTLIIILVSLVAVGIIWIVVRNVIQRGSEGIQMGQFTLDAKIKNVNLENISNNVNLTVKRNPGEGAFTGLKFIFYDGRNSEVITQTVSLNELEERGFNFHLNILNVSQLVSISIVPILNVNGKETIGNVLDKYTVRGSEQYQFICTPATCSGLGYICGTWSNGTCSGTLNCGNCSGGYVCSSGGTCVASCTPTTCLALGYECNIWSNGTCSGNLNCGNCSSYGAGYTCNATGRCVSGGDSSLIAYYPFSGNANDESGNGNNGIVYGAVLTTDKNGNPNSAYQFDGVNDYVNMGDVLDMGTRDMTISAWVKTSYTGDYSFFVSKSYYGAGNYRYSLYTSPTTGNVGIFIQGNGGSDVMFNGNAVVADGNWHFVTFVFNRSGNAQIYVNGVYDTSQTISQWNGVNFDSNHPFRIGSYTDSDNIGIKYPFNGIIDEVRIYNRILTPAEIATLAGLTQCSDGIDNDGNGCSDYPADTGCSSLSDTTESGGTCIDVTPPVRSNGLPSGSLPAGTTQTTISLNTNENAVCRYSTSAGTSYSSMTNTFTTTGGTSHSRLITGLQNGTVYNYYVRCNDTAGNVNTNDYLISFSVGSGGTIYALSCSYTDVSNAINSANIGDTVRVPAGTCTWSNSLLITKGIKLMGAGIGNTTIRRGAANIIVYVPADYTLNAPFRVSGFSFDQVSEAYGYSLIHLGKDFDYITDVGPAQTNIRIDHNRFYSTTEIGLDAQCIQHTAQMFGVVDNNIFDNHSYPIRNINPAWGSLLWDRWGTEGYSYAPGDKYNLYFEDNIFNLGTGSVDNVITDSQFSGRYAYRYNTMIRSPGTSSYSFMDVHGIQSMDMHASFGAEVYGNDVIGGTGGITFLQTRGGVTTVHHNSVNVGSGFSTSTSSVMCPGEPYRSLEMIHDTYFFLNRVGYTGSLLGSSRDSSISCGGRARPEEGIDFFDDVSTPGITCGTLANRPTTCNIGQGYWATTQSCTSLSGMVGKNPTTPISGTLYKCTATNTWTAYYIPYTYPHPLTLV